MFLYNCTANMILPGLIIPRQIGFIKVNFLTVCPHEIVPRARHPVKVHDFHIDLSKTQCLMLLKLTKTLLI